MKNIYLLLLLFLLFLQGVTAQNFEWVQVFEPQSSSVTSTVTDIKVDSQGNTYSVGFFNGTIDLDPGVATNLRTSPNGNSSFIIKLDAAGVFVWGHTILNSQLYAVDIQSNRVVVGGDFLGSTDFDPGFGFSNSISAGGGDAFIVEFNAIGAYQWSDEIGGIGNESIGDLSIDINGDILVVGRYKSDVTLSNGNLLIHVGNGYNAFLVKYNNLGTLIFNKEWSTNSSNNNSFSLITKVQTDGLGDIILLGSLNSYGAAFDYDPNSSVYNSPVTSSGEIFIMKLSSNGLFQWVNIFANGFTLSVLDIEVSLNDNIYFLMGGMGNLDFDLGPGVNNVSITNSVLAKYQFDGSFVWATNISAPGSLGLSPNQDIYINSNNKVEKRNSLGTLMWTANITGLHSWSFSEICIDNLDNVFIGSNFANTVDFDPSSAIFNKTAIGGLDAYVLKLTPCSETVSSLYLSECSTYTVPSGDETYTVSGVYNDTVPNAAGCDSIITITLVINNTTSTISAIQCGGNYTVPSGDETYTTSGTFNDTIPNAVGCDSIMTINLTINSPTSSTQSIINCSGSYTVPSGDESYTSSGIYSDTIPNSVGCDSVMTISLTIGSQTSSTSTVTQCSGSYTVPSGDETYTISGTYTDTIPNLSGCDSVITISLTLALPTTSSISVTQCGSSYIVPSGDETYTTSGIYKDTIPNTAGCDSIITISLTLNPIPQIQFTNTSGICLNDVFSFTNNSTINAPDVITSQTWDMESDGVVDYTTLNVGHLYTTSGNIDVTLHLISNNGCENTLTQSIIVGDLPLVNFSASTVCVNGDPTMFINNSTIATGSNTLFGWSFGDGGVSTGENPFHNYTIAASYPVTLRVVSNLGCVDSVTYSVDILGKPSADFAQDAIAECAPMCVNFIDQSFDDILIDHWSWKFENNFGESFSQHPNHCFLNDGTFDISLIIRNTQGCKDTIEKVGLITAFAQPVSAFTFTPESTDVLSPEIDFINNSTDAIAWSWNFADGTEENLVDYDPVHLYGDTGHFEVALIVYNNALCSDTSYHVIEVLPVDEIFVPSAFSPNGDGKNDILYARGYISKMYFAIFDRLGKKVFESSDKENGWDGLINGKKAIGGVYSWYLQAEVNNKDYKLKGDVTLVR